MPVVKGQRLKLLKIWEILNQETDSYHTMDTPTLLSRLNELGIVCDRRTLYSDIKALNEGGYKISCLRRASNEYYVEKNQFSIAELHILIDAVQAASFVTEQKTKALVDKIAELAGSRRAEVIKHNVVSFNTTKSVNEDIFRNVATISQCIEKFKQLEFLYFDYDLCGKKIYRKDNKIYVVNPIATIFSNDKYYLLCYDDKHGNLSHYRIDRMDNVNISVKEITPSDHFDSSLIQRHKRQLFGMYNGDEQEVMFECDKSIVDAVYDKFGFDIQLYDVSHNKFRFSAKVQLSPVFFGWCCSFGDKLKIASPEKVRTEFLSYIKTVGNNN